MKKILLGIVIANEEDKDFVEENIKNIGFFYNEIKVQKVESLAIDINSILQCVDRLRKEQKEECAISVVTNHPQFIEKIYNAQSQDIDHYYLICMNNYGKTIVLKESSKTIGVICKSKQDLMRLMLVNPVQIQEVIFTEHMKSMQSEAVYLRYKKYLLKQYRLKDNEISEILLADYLYHNVGNYEQVDELYWDIVHNESESIVQVIENEYHYFSPEVRCGLLMAVYLKTKDRKYMFKVLEEALELKLEIAQSLYWNITRMNFVGDVTLGEEGEILRRKFFRKIVDMYRERLNTLKLKVDQTIRKKVVILGNQFLGIRHATTRNILDYSYCLKKLGYEVMIVNTGDFISKSQFHFLYYCEGNFLEKYNNITFIKYKGEKIDFYQNTYMMPNVLGEKKC